MGALAAGRQVRKPASGRRSRKSAQKKALRLRRASKGDLDDTLFGFSSTALELGGELFNAARSVDKAFLASVGGMRIHGNVADHNEIVLTLDLLLASRFHGGASQEAFAGAYIEEANVVESGMAFGFHGGIKEVRESTLARFVAGFDFVDDVDLATTADHLAGRVTLLRRFDGGDDFHKRAENTVRRRSCQIKIREVAGSRADQMGNPEKLERAGSPKAFRSS